MGDVADCRARDRANVLRDWAGEQRILAERLQNALLDQADHGSWAFLFVESCFPIGYRACGGFRVVREYLPSAQ